jgi:hypothetical protein
VALKRIRSGALAGEEELKRFRAEAEAAAHLDHQSIVPIYEVGEHEGHPYYSMAFIDGQSLEDRVKKGPLTPREAARLMKQVAEAVHYAHARGVIHRDLKPANILVTADGQAKVTDFGLAKKVESDAGLTATGRPMGTPSYMAPEQAQGKSREVGPLSDVYALGATLYCLLTGRPPFPLREATGLLETLRQVKEEPPVPPGKWNPAVDLDLQTITLKCMEKRTERRYGSAHELVDELDRYLKKEPIHARPIGRLERSWRWCRRKPTQAASLLLLLTLALGGPLLAWQQTWLLREAERDRASAERSAANAQLGRVARLIDTNPAQARDLLLDEKQFSRRLRGFTWRALRHRLDRKSKILMGHRDLVHGMAFSPDSRRLASVDWTGTVKLWDVSTGRELKTLFQPRIGITRAELHLRKDADLYQGFDRGYRGDLRGGFQTRAGPIFSACGRYLLTQRRPYPDRDEEPPWWIRQPPELCVFGLEDGSLTTFQDVGDFEFSPTEPLLAFPRGDQLFLLWLRDGRTAQLRLPDGFSAVSIYFNRAGDEIRLVSRDGRLARVSLARGPLTLETNGSLKNSAGMESRGAHSPDGKRVAVLVARSLGNSGNEKKPRVEWWLEVYDSRPECIARARVAGDEKPGFSWLSDDRLRVTLDN